MHRYDENKSRKLYLGTLEMITKIREVGYMSVSKLINDFIKIPTQSETEVRTKFVNPLFVLLGYPIECRAEEFPVYGYEGGKPIRSKSADVLFFDSMGFASNRNRNNGEINWVCEHSLLVVEIKKRGESIDVEGQAVYYAAWTRTPLYVITNGEHISFYKINNNFSDELVLKCDVKQIAEKWDLISSVFSYPNSITLKGTTSCIKKNFENEIYSEYCNNLLINLDENLKSMVRRDVNKKSNNYFETILSTSEHEKINYLKMLENNKGKIIVSEPGGGKTYLLDMIAREKLSNMQEYTGKVPILIKCEYYGILYDSVEKAIYNEVVCYYSDLTLEMVKNDIQKGKFVLLFDALDEVKTNKSALANSIKQYMMTTANEIIVTERKENYSCEFDVLCDLYEIQPLSKEIVAKYIYDNTNKKVSIYQLNLSKQFQDLLATPLFLYIVVEILNNQPDNIFGIPKNKSKLFELFYRYPLKDKFSAVEHNLLEEIFSKYAEFLIYNQESNAKLIEITQSVVGNNQCEKYFQLIIKTGIMVKGVNGYRFFHYTFLEYFYAKELSKKRQGEIEIFLDKYVNNKGYSEIICLLVGIISDSNKQNYVLDYLQLSNLPLFIRALESRYKFERFAVDTEYDYSYEYFLQIRNTYDALIKEYFVNVRNYFSPYTLDFNDKINKIKIIGKIDYEQLGINVKFEITTKDDEDVSYTKLEGHPKIYIGNSTTAISIFSMAMPGGNFYYNLKDLYLGIDSAREIALRILKKQLFELIDKKIVLDMDNKVLMAEAVEMVLEYLNKRKQLPEEIIGLSLYKNPKEVLDFFVINQNKPPIYDISFHGPKIPFVVFLVYCQILLSSQIDVKEILGVKRDLSYNDLYKQEKTCYSSDLYSDCRLLEAVKKVIMLTEQSYNELLEVKFDKLKEYMSHYKKYCYKIVWIERNQQYGAGVDEIDIKVDENKEGIELINGEKGANYPYINDERVKKKLSELGCTNNDIISGSSCVIHEFLKDGVFHERVYKVLKNDFEKILGKK